MKNLFLLLFMFPVICLAQPFVKNDTTHRQLIFGNTKMQMTIDFSKKTVISSLVLNGESVLDTTGIYSFIKTKKETYSTLHPSLISIKDNVIKINIPCSDKIQETWKFTVTEKDIRFDIDRKISGNIIAEEVASPHFMFRSINTWEGAYQGYGGLAWFYLFNKTADTYGVHSNSSDFWNSKTGNGLSVVVDAPDVVMTYSRMDDKLSYNIGLSPGELRFDSATYRRRYIRDRTDVWAPVNVKTSHTSITLSYFNFNDKYGRGKFVGINGDQVSAVLNTIARIGVIDKEHFGGNSWHTPYGPICLHEQYIAQLGLAINDTHYLKGYQQCLDYYRDNAIKPDGRVWARWAYTNEDMMPGEVTDKGFYEAQWGYLLDANPDFVTNVAELYDQTGDIKWVKTHQQSCEQALDWLLKRDSNNNGLVEMINDNHTEKKSSDWIDIIWASYENAFVNAKLYHALTLWADIEKQLGDLNKADYYQQFAAKLKTSFNKPVSEGGFWDGSCYIHWRDKDGSTHGNNMVTPVNFMAIGYGICDDKLRTKTILDKIENQMQKEQLFFWPICMYSYNKGEGNDWQFPFPNYENGDLFLSWGALGVKAYADYKPELAVKYVKNVLAQYAKDGLAFQRYGRTKQDGLGDDILSGNSLSVVGLYQAVYGVNPLYNRFYLNPHITSALAGTHLKYNFRGQVLQIDLAMNKYAVSNGQFKITSDKDFGFYSVGKELLYFNGAGDKASLIIKTDGKLDIEIKTFTADSVLFSQSSANTNKYQVNDLKTDSYYTILVNKQILKKIKTKADGSLIFSCKAGNNLIAIENK